MVEKKRGKIAKLPQAQSDPDSWVSDGGLDPEINLSSSDSVAKDEKVQEKTYPHRISFDMDSSQYKRLKWASFDTSRPMNSILREAVEEWMKSRDY